MRPPSDAYDLFSSTLRPWHHYVPIAPDFSDLYAAYLWAVGHVALASKIAANGAKAASVNASRVAAIAGWQDVLYSRRTTQRPCALMESTAARLFANGAVASQALASSRAVVSRVAIELAIDTNMSSAVGRHTERRNDSMDRKYGNLSSGSSSVGGAVEVASGRVVAAGSEVAHALVGQPAAQTTMAESPSTSPTSKSTAAKEEGSTHACGGGQPNFSDPLTPPSGVYGLFMRMVCWASAWIDGSRSISSRSHSSRSRSRNPRSRSGSRSRSGGGGSGSSSSASSSTASNESNSISSGGSNESNSSSSGGSRPAATQLLTSHAVRSHGKVYGSEQSKLELHHTSGQEQGQQHAWGRRLGSTRGGGRALEGARGSAIMVDTSMASEAIASPPASAEPNPKPKLSSSPSRTPNLLASALLLVPHAMIAGRVPRLKPFEQPLDSYNGPGAESPTESPGAESPGAESPGMESPAESSLGTSRDGQSVRGQQEHGQEQPVGTKLPPPAWPVSTHSHLPIQHLTSHQLTAATLCCDGAAARAALPPGQLRARSLIYFFRAWDERTPPRTTMERCADSFLRTPSAYRGAVCSTTQLCSRRAPSSVFIQETAWRADQVSLLSVGATPDNNGVLNGTKDTAHHNGRHHEPSDDTFLLWAADAAELAKLASPAVPVVHAWANRALNRSTDARRNRSKPAALMQRSSQASTRQPPKASNVLHSEAFAFEAFDFEG